MFIDPQTDYHGTTKSTPKPKKGWYTMKDGKPVTAAPTPKPSRYAKPKPAAGLPKWFLDIRAGSEFMPAKVKPYSYNYMAMVETPLRQGLYAPGGWAQPSGTSGTDLSLQFNTPTGDVAKGIKANYNFRRDEQNLGLEPTERKESFFQKAIDIISRPLYAIANQHKVNTDLHYRSPESAGGEKVTFSEHIQGFIHDFSPVGAVADVIGGTFDDRFAAGWRGITGKDKTTTHTILEEEYPGFTKEHPKLAIAASIAGDLAFDPINWVSFGAAGPATATKSVASVGLRIAGRKALAKKLLEETLLTSTGRQAAKDVLRNDAFQAEMRKLGRIQKGLDKNAAKAAAGKATKLTEAQYRLAADVVGQSIRDSVAADIRGADLAWRTLKRGAPTLGIGTLSRANIGASHWRKVSAANALINVEQAAFVNSAIEATKDKEHWHAVYAAMKDDDTGKIADFTYKTPNGESYTVPFSQAKGFKDFMAMIYLEGAPLAKLQEGNVKAARARNLRIAGVEARGRSFEAAFSTKFKTDIANSLGPIAGKEFDKLRTKAHTVHSHMDASDIDLKNPQLVHMTEDQLDNLSFDQLKNLAKRKFNDNKPQGSNKKFGNDDPKIVVHREDGSKKAVSIRNLKAQADAATRERSEALLARAAADMRSAADKAADVKAGVSDRVAVARARLLETHKNLTGAKANKTAAQLEALGQRAVRAVGRTEAAKAIHAELLNKAPQEVRDIYDKVTEVLTSDRYTDKEKAAFNSILNDFSLTMEERIAKVLNHIDVDDEEVGRIIREIAQVEMKDGELFASVVGEGSGPEALKMIINEILKHRVTSRIGKIDAANVDEVSPMLKASGHRIVTDDSGNVKVVKADKATGTLAERAAFQRDLQGELGMAVLDAYRYAIDYAIKAEMLEDHELLFKTIGESVDVFLNKELAGLKRDVFQLIHNITGIRLPEELVPKLDDIQKMFPAEGPKGYTWRTASGEVANQEVPWKNLSMDLIRWTTDTMRKDVGIKFESFKQFETDVRALARQPISDDAHILARVTHWRNKVEGLVTSANASPRALNDTTPVVNRYTFLDYLIHGDSILKSQDMTIHTVAVGDKKVNRLTSGRLSALDSFAYVDEEVRGGLQALSELKKLMRNKDKELAGAAKRTWALLFVEAGGLDAIPKAANQDFGEAFSSLGIHARLKEDVVGSSNKTLGTKQRADLMDALWGKQSLHHEWQKAMQQRILFDTMVDGKLPEHAAEVIGAEVEKFFQDYENIKRILHPVRVPGGPPIDMQVREIGRGVQANRVNQFNYKSNNPITDVPEFEFPYHVNLDETVIPSKPKAFANPSEKRNFLEVSLSPGPETKAYARTEGNVAWMREQIMGNAANITVHEIKEGSNVHGLIIDKPVSVQGSLRSEKARYLVTADTPNGPFDTYHVLSPAGSPQSAFSKATELQHMGRPRKSVSIPEGQNIPGASVSGKVNVIEPQRIFEGGSTGAKSALSGTSEEQRARVGQLMAELQNVNRAREGEKKALQDFAAARNNPEGLGVTAPVEQAAFENARKVYVNELKGEETDPSDFVNVSPEDINYSTAEMDRIRAWIAKTYGDAPPAVLARQMHALSNALSFDILMAQGQIVSYMKDWDLLHKANMRAFGIPLMNLPHAMNMTHTEAGVTALAQSQSRARRTLTAMMNPTMTTGKQRELAMNFQRRSHVLNKQLDQIASSYANAASISRQQIIPALNALYKSINKGKYLDPAVGALGRKPRFTKINNQLFNPAANKVGDPLKMFDQDEIVNGITYNPVKEIENGFKEVGVRYFGDLKERTSDLTMLKKRIKAFNTYIVDKYRYSDADLEKIDAAIEKGHVIREIVPYSTEWLREVGGIVDSNSKLGRSRLLDINLGELHYAVHDSHLKLRAGDALHNGVWAEFASIMPYEQVRFYNEKVHPQMIGSDGEPMRGKLVNIKEVLDNGYYGIKSDYIPAQFRNGSYWVSEDILPDVRTLFEYMDKSHQLNDTINTHLFDKIMNYFKSSVTIYNIPTYPVRNLMSDVFLSAMDGLINPRYYGDAAKILYSQRQDMKNMKIEDYSNIIDQNFLKRHTAAAQHDPDSVMDPMLNPNKPVSLRLATATGKIELNDDQIMHLYNQLGLGQNRVSGDIPEAVAAARLGGTHAKAGAGTDKIRKLNDIREDWGRLSHFLYALEHEALLGGNLDQIARRAGDRVIKYHFDYSDVSLFDRGRVARHIPFYKWVKNIVPFTLANMVLNPKFLNIERGLSAMAGNLMNDDPEAKEDFIIADWILGDMPVPIGTWSDPNGNEFQQFASMYLPLSGTITSTLAPTLDPLSEGKLTEAGAGAISTGVGMTNPIIKAIYHAVSGESAIQGSSVPEKPGESWVNELEGIIPGMPMLNNISKTGSSWDAGGSEGKNKAAQILQMLGAERVYNNTEAVQKGQLKQMEDAQRANIGKGKAVLIEKLKAQYPNATEANLKIVVDEYIMKNLRSNDATRL